MDAAVKVLVGFEKSGIVRDAFIAKGHDAISCDRSPCERPGPHIQGDLWGVLSHSEEWDLAIFHPECTYLCGSGLHWNKKDPGRQRKTEAALIDVDMLLNGLYIPKVCVENPVGCISSRIRLPDQYIQPHMFGADASKKTGLWLKNLPLLVPTERVAPRCVVRNGKEYKRWANQTDSGQNRLGPSPTRAADRSRTYQGIADAMADQWG
jgi:hypothetical protein